LESLQAEEATLSYAFHETQVRDLSFTLLGHGAHIQAKDDPFRPDTIEISLCWTRSSLLDHAVKLTKTKALGKAPNVSCVKPEKRSM
jgi:hypothetical protein